MFTGDRSGDFLYAALHRAGLANQPNATHLDDGLELKGVYVAAAIRCAPPRNKPTPDQLERCRPFLAAEIRVLWPGVILCLGAIAWNASMAALESLNARVPKPKPRFVHGHCVQCGDHAVLGCYHVSQQNTFTGRLTASMLDDVLAHARSIIEA